MRAFLLVMDSLGLGAAPDAQDYGDVGANTFGHIALACAEGRGDGEGLRVGPLRIPTLLSLGLGLAAREASGLDLPFETPGRLRGAYGWAQEISRGKDTPSGHWEMAGLPVDFDWSYFPDAVSCFPPELIEAIVEQGAIPGALGLRHASGTTVIEELGETHLLTGAPIIYTSADSVVQIAAHEEAFGLERLYRLCEMTRKLIDPYNVGRVIARPFLGDRRTGFVRTGNRRDYVTPPHGPTLLDTACEAGRDVVAVGKIADIFAGRGVTHKVKAASNMAVGAAVMRKLEDASEGSLTFANFNDFDTLFGHRRNVAGYALALEEFDVWLAGFLDAMAPGDLLAISADHGCDPTWPGSDHTREYVPVLLAGDGVEPVSLGRRTSFADVGQSIATHLHLPPLGCGVSCLAETAESD